MRYLLLLLKKKKKSNSCRLLTALLLGLTLLLTACQSRLVVDINLRTNGSGEVGFSVIFDGATVTKFPELLDLINIEDLNDRGWQTANLTSTETNANREISVTKNFFTDLQIQRLLNEISPDAFKVSVERVTRSGKTTLSLKGELNMTTFRKNLFSNSNIDLTELETKLKPETNLVKIVVQIGEEDDFSIETIEVPLTSNGVVKIEHTHNLEESDSQLWLWISVAAFSLFFIAIAINIMGWAYKKRQGNANLKWVGKPKNKLKK